MMPHFPFQTTHQGENRDGVNFKIVISSKKNLKIKFFKFHFHASDKIVKKDEFDLQVTPITGP